MTIYHAFCVTREFYFLVVVEYNVKEDKLFVKILYIYWQYLAAVDDDIIINNKNK